MCAIFLMEGFYVCVLCMCFKKQKQNKLNYDDDDDDDDDAAEDDDDDDDVGR
jgi:hypothetical protein